MSDSSAQFVAVDQLRPGDRLEQDVAVGFNLLLRRGYILQAAQIRRLRALDIREVSVSRSAPEAAVVPRVSQLGELAVQEAVGIALPDFRKITSEDSPGWMAAASFSQPVPASPQLSAGEELLATHKDTLRQNVGLKPLIDREQEQLIAQGLQSTLISAALSNHVNLKRVDDLAQSFAGALGKSPQGYLELPDVQRYGDALTARSLLSGKLFSLGKWCDSLGALIEHLRGHLALCSCFALLPSAMAAPIDQMSPAELAALKDALLKYYSWLRAQGFVEEHALETLFLRFERFDGSGIPYGLKGEALPEPSQFWGLAWSYSEKLFSQPKRPRSSPRQAADGLTRQAGTAFAGSVINSFLRVVGLFPPGSLVELSDGRKALVTRQNERALLRPVVRVAQDDGQVAEELDLAQDPRVFIRQPVLEY